ncbi:MAG TPA: VIT domain-containing protein [Pyrinomonadaceae bacterium]|jgi:Ca-activated chloride channel family protein
MNRSLLLRPALLALVCALLAFALDAAAEHAAARPARRAADKLTQGSLRVPDASGRLGRECPLKHTAVRAEVSGFISRVTVTQEFENPFEDKIEAVYVFPLPQGAAVDDMTMLVGGRVIRARIMRREEAQAAYRQARARGHVATLLDQERPNIFTQSVANILPGQSVKVTISYVETLRYEAGTYEWSFPMVVAERYTPSGGGAEGPPAVVHPEGSEGDERQDAAAAQPQQSSGGLTQEASGAQDAGAGTAGAARTDAPPEGMRAGHDISVEVSIDAGVPLEAVASGTHEVEVERRGGAGALVRLKGGAAIPNKDFVLKYDVAGGRVEDALLTHASSRGRFFTLILQPPERPAPAQIVPKELVFVLDTSGSMSGFPLEKAKETMRLALEGLNPQDTFNLITFAGDTHVLFPRPVPATRANLSKAKKFLDSRRGDGGTEMMKAIRAALADTDSADHVRVVCFMTDGDVGNDFEIIAEVQKHPKARVFSMGFSSAPNRFLLDKMAEYGRGEVEYVGDSDPGSAAARRFHERVRDPLLTDVAIEWEGLAVSDVYPKNVPDLFGAKPVVVVGRYAGGANGRIRLRGRTAGGDFVREVAVTLPDAEARHDVLATLWARRRVDELMGRDMAGMQTGTPAGTLREEITRLGLDFRLLTQFTSFVAVEDAVVTDGGEPRRVDVPAEEPSKAAPAAAPAQGAAVAAGGSALPPGFAGVQETVTVLSSLPVQVNYSSTLNSTVQMRSVEELPINGRSALSLATLAPGSAPSAGGGNGLSFNGQRPRSNSLVVDGVSADVDVTPAGRGAGASLSAAAPGLAAGGGANGAAPAAAAQEMTVRTEHVEPQYGRTTGAQVNVVTRSGTNAAHGSAFGYFGHESLDANDWFANREGVGRRPRRFADFGGTLGGPLKKDQTFFFTSYEGQRARRPAFSVTEVPGLAARVAAPEAVRPFLEAFPVPTGPARADGFAEFAAGYTTPARLDVFGLRIDHNRNTDLTLNARYAAAGSRAEARGAGGASLNTLERVRSLAQTLTGGLNYVVTPETVAEVRANYSRVSARGSRLLDAFGGAVVPDADTASGALLTEPGGSFVFDLGGRGASLARAAEAATIQRQLNLVGSLNRVSGEHTYKLGGDYRRLSPVVGLRASERDFYFAGVAGALTSTAARAGEFTHAGPSRPVFEDLAAYAQDEWRPARRLTLNYGLRWELAPAPHAGGGTTRPLAVTQAEDPSRLAPAAQGTPLWRTTWLNFAPRAGLAYQLSDAAGRELSVRAGFGLFYDTGRDESGRAFADSYPFKVGGAAFDVPFAVGGAATLPAGARLASPLSAFDPGLKLPYTLRWNVSVERGLGRGQSLTAGYVGAAGRRLLLTRTLTDPSPDFSLVRLTTNGGASDYHSARLQFRRNLRRGLEAVAAYTWAKSLDDFSEDTPALALLRGDEARAERGPSDFDVRHTAAGFVSYELPAPFEGGAWGALSRGWALDAVFNARSARPLNVVYGFPLSYGLGFLRPDLAGGAPLYVADGDAPGGWRVNPAAFVLPGVAQQGRQGTLGRNALRGFPFYRLDAALRREFKLGDEVKLQLRAEAFNLLNHPNFEDPVATLAFGSLRAPRPDAYFGRSLSAGGAGWAAQGGGFGPAYGEGGARTVQLSLRLTF